jgi:hypothetical protein
MIALTSAPLKGRDSIPSRSDEFLPAKAARLCGLFTGRLSRRYALLMTSSGVVGSRLPACNGSVAAMNRLAFVRKTLGFGVMPIHCCEHLVRGHLRSARSTVFPILSIEGELLVELIRLDDRYCMLSFKRLCDLRPQRLPDLEQPRLPHPQDARAFVVASCGLLRRPLRSRHALTPSAACQGGMQVVPVLDLAS